MGKVVAIANQKGGVGKSTTAINLSACLSEKGKKVLVIDVDPQGNTTSGFGIDKNGDQNSLYEMISDDLDIKDVIIKNAWHSLDLIPSNINLSGAEVELLNEEDPQNVLKGKIDKIKRSYDFIIMDCPPSLSILTINALSAAGSVIVPIQCEYYALEGLSQLIETIQLVQDRINQKLKIEGILFTMYDVRNRLSSQVVENVKENLDQKIFDTVIPRNVRLAEAPSFGMPVIEYDPKSSGAASYDKLADELIAAGGK